MISEVSALARESAPYSRIGIVQTEWPDGTLTVGTFSIVGRNDLLTAAHLVFDPLLGGWAKGFDFYLAADYNFVTDRFESPGTELLFSKFTIAAYPDLVYVDNDDHTLTSGESQYDIAIIGLDRAVGEQFGWLRLTPGAEGEPTGSPFTAYAVGYPTDGTGMMQDIISVHALSQFDVYQSDRASLKPGSSGGPLLRVSESGAVSTSVLGVMSTRGADGSTWSDLDATYDDLLLEMGKNNVLIGESDHSGDPAYVIADVIQTNTEDGIALAKTLAGIYAIDTVFIDQGDTISDGAVVLMKSAKKAWVLKSTLSIEHVSYNEATQEYLLGLEKPGAKKTSYFEQAFNDQTGRPVGALTKVVNPEWAGFGVAANSVGHLPTAGLDVQLTVLGSVTSHEYQVSV